MVEHIKKQITIAVFSAIIFIVFAQVAYPGLGLDFEVPAPEESRLLDTKAFRWGDKDIHSSLYKSKQNQYDIINNYKRFFTAQGFWVILEKRLAAKDKSLLRFKKEDLVVTVTITPQPPETQVVIAKYLQPEGSLSPEKQRPSLKRLFSAMPKTDQPGEDLKFIPRPPESVRWMSRGSAERYLLLYATELSVAEVIKYYKAQMTYQAWELTEEVATDKTMEKYRRVTGKKDLGISTPFTDGEDLNQVINDSYVLEFKGSYGQTKIIIFPNFVDRKLGSLVQILYSKQTR